jgi:hypothetical protein
MGYQIASVKLDGNQGIQTHYVGAVDGQHSYIVYDKSAEVLGSVDVST